MDQTARNSLLDQFSALDDPRQAAKVLYPLPEILLLLLCATLAGAEDFVEMTLWGNRNLDFLRRLRPFAQGIPSHDTLGEVGRSRAVQIVLHRLGRRAARERTRYHRHRWQDLAPHPCPLQGPRAAASVVFHDDLARLRTAYGPENMAVVKHFAVNLVHAAKPITSLKNRRKLAGWDLAYLETLIRGTA